MIPEVHCPPDGPVIGFNLITGEKYANCFACSRCGGCARGFAFMPLIDFRRG